MSMAPRKRNSQIACATFSQKPPSSAYRFSNSTGIDLPPKWKTLLTRVPMFRREAAGISYFRSVARLIFSKEPKQEDVRAVSFPLKGSNPEIDARRQQR
jgi:hypothetical protein